MSLILGMALNADTPPPHIIQNVWVTKAPRPLAATFPAAAVLGGKFYAVGGWSTSEVVQTGFHEYDPLTDSWTTRSPLPAPRMHHAAVGLGGKVYVLGGRSTAFAGSVSSTVYAWNQASNAWTTVAPLPAERHFLSATAIGGKIYVACGANEAEVLQTICWSYDPTTNAWTTVAPLPVATFGAASGVLNGKMYVQGGTTGGGITGATREYDPTLNAWTLLTSGNAAQSPAGGGMSDPSFPDGVLYSAGGFNVTPTTNHSRYERVANNWTAVAPLPDRRYGAAAGTIDGRLYYVNGTNNGAGLASGGQATLFVYG